MFWHSSAHVLGEAAERHYGCHLCIGPPTDDGFFYEMAIEDRYGTTISVTSYYSPALQSGHERRLPCSRENFGKCDQGKTEVRKARRI